MSIGSENYFGTNIMLTNDEIIKRANKSQISPVVIYREFAQLIFLERLTHAETNANFIFKGGTAIRFLMKSDRFSEDLDFTIKGLTNEKVISIISSIVKHMNSEVTVSMKSVPSPSGLTLKLFIVAPFQQQPIPVKLDFSFRETCIDIQHGTITCDYPIIFRNFCYFYSPAEMIAEKVRALLHRQKGRDLYDLWFLLSMQAEFDKNLINQKLAYYSEAYSQPVLIEKIKRFPKKDFVADLLPFVGKKERNNLDNLYDVIESYLMKKIQQ